MSQAEYTEAMDIAQMADLDIDWFRSKDNPTWAPSLSLAVMSARIKRGQQELVMFSSSDRLNKILYHLRFTCNVPCVATPLPKDETGKNIFTDDAEIMMAKKYTVYSITKR